LPHEAAADVEVLGFNLIARGKNALFGEGAGGLCDLLLLFAQIFRRKDIFRPKIFNEEAASGGPLCSECRDG
jgi:hypothetical protein